MSKLSSRVALVTGGSWRQPEDHSRETLQILYMDYEKLMSVGVWRRPLSRHRNEFL
jgi:hypothetical protein